MHCVHSGIISLPVHSMFFLFFYMMYTVLDPITSLSLLCFSMGKSLKCQDKSYESSPMMHILPNRISPHPSNPKIHAVALSASVHPTNLLYGSGQGTGMAMEEP